MPGIGPSLTERRGLGVVQGPLGDSGSAGGIGHRHCRGCPWPAGQRRQVTARAEAGAGTGRSPLGCRVAVLEEARVLGPQEPAGQGLRPAEAVGLCPGPQGAGKRNQSRGEGGQEWLWVWATCFYISEHRVSAQILSISTGTGGAKFWSLGNRPRGDWITWLSGLRLWCSVSCFSSCSAAGLAQTTNLGPVIITWFFLKNK